VQWDQIDGKLASDDEWKEEDAAWIRTSFVISAGQMYQNFYNMHNIGEGWICDETGWFPLWHSKLISPLVQGYDKHIERIEERRNEFIF
jgi:hypothetical protein